MAVSATNTYTAAGLAEDFEDIINNVSPSDTPLYTLAKKKKATGKYHQWQVESLAAAAANKQLEGDDASYATLTATTVLGNYCQIARKTVQISGTYDAVKKYGRKSELAHQLVKVGKELRRDIEYALVRNAASDDGSAGTARGSAGFESWIKGNNIKSNTGQTTPGFSAGIVAAPTDGTATTFLEADLKLALAAAWADGGDPSVIMMSTTNKTRFDAFTGIATKYNEVKGSTQATTISAADVYVSSFGNHKVVLNRYMRDNAVLCIDPDYVSVASLRPIQQEPLAKTGDSEKRMMLAEFCLVVDSLDAHAKISGIGS
jgi:hypothetical protein